MEHWSLMNSILCSLLVSSLVCDAFELTILHTNDVHARVRQTSKYGSACRKEDADEGKCFGGVARRLTKIREIRERGSNVLLLDAGDQFQGTIWFTYYQGDKLAGFMNNLTYDAMALGNHEFDIGVEGLVSFLEEVNFPVLASNLDVSAVDSMAGLVKKSTIKSFGEVKIGIIGYVTASTPAISSPDISLKFNSVIEAVTKESKRLKEDEKVDIIIALGHDDWEIDLAIAKVVPHVNIVVSGHDDIFLYSGEAPSDPEKALDSYPVIITPTSDNSRKVLVAQAYTFGKYLGFLNVTFNEDMELTSFNGNPILLDNSVSQDDDLLKIVEDLSVAVDEFASEITGNAAIHIDGTREACRSRECGVGNLVTDAMVYDNIYDKRSDGGQWGPAAIAMQNGGGIRTSIERGVITRGNVMEVFPFLNEIVVLELDGRTLKHILEMSISWTVESSLNQSGGFLQVSGLQLEYNLCLPIGYRLVSSYARCLDCSPSTFQPIADHKIYPVLMPSFLANGGDNFELLKNFTQKQTPTGDVDVVVDFIKSRSPMMYGQERRIQLYGRCGSVSCYTASVLCLVSSLLFFVF